MKTVCRFLMIPLLVAIVGVAGFGLCKLAGWPPNGRGMLAAGACAVVAGAMAVVPLFLTRGANQGTVSQAGLAGTVIHLFGTIILTALIWNINPITGPRNAFLLWLLTFYWTSLGGLVVMMLQAVKAALPSQPSEPLTPTAPTSNSPAVPSQGSFHAL